MSTSPGAAMNMGTLLAIYATLARETGIPFVFSALLEIASKHRFHWSVARP